MASRLTQAGWKLDMKTIISVSNSTDAACISKKRIS
ncbi:hypothetical protein ACEQPO_02240 [Bacillus sp. SL00103]